ncbi:MAG: HAD family hydrolase [Acidobacteriia bacterium]|nr:HAD family hydrolase [Terriglobia bacterium]
MVTQKPIAIFLDRDGTICEEVGYVNHPSRCRLLPFAATAIQKINDAGLKAVVVSNQAGVARGYFSEELVHEVHRKIAIEIGKARAHIDAIYYCPHHPDGSVAEFRKVCECRKPRPGLLQRAERELGVDLQRSFVVGDRYSDVELAALNGLQSVLVLTGYGRGEWEYHRHEWKYQPHWVCENVLEAVEKIIATLTTAVKS